MKSYLWSPGSLALAVKVPEGKTKLEWEEYLVLLRKQVKELQVPRQLYEEEWWTRMGGEAYLDAAVEDHVLSDQFQEMLAQEHQLRKRNFPMEVNPEETIDPMDEIADPLDWLANLLPTPGR